MARFGEHAVSYTFTSDRFDHVSELPPDANAGNRFYGRDVAELIAAGLSARGLDGSYFDEDWGWQVHGRRGDGSVLEVSIYHNPDGDPRQEDDWALMVRLLRRGGRLVPRLREAEVDEEASATLEAILRDAGIRLERESG